MPTQNLINVTNRTIGKHTVQTVNARELHEFLETRSKFAEWINRRINEYKFLENQDFICLSEISKPNAKTVKKAQRSAKNTLLPSTWQKN